MSGHTRGQRWLRDMLFVLAVALSGVTTAALLAAGGRAVAAGAAVGANSTRTAPTATKTLATGVARVVAADTRNFQMPQPNAGLMQDAVDHQGNVWFGEMNLNLLGRLDPTTGQVTSWSPPNGKYNIMQTAIDAQDNVWFTEQGANYIGKFDQQTQRFTTYALPLASGHSAAPQDLAFDSRGNLWFTEISGAAIGRLDVATGAIKLFPVPAPSSTTPAYPFSLAVAAGDQIWFGDLAGGAVGHLDPTTGKVEIHHLRNPQAQVFSMAADRSGHVWFTELEQGTLGMIDTSTGKVTEYGVPPTLGPVSGMYAVVATTSGDVWFACASANAIVRYQPADQQFTYYTLSVPASVPYGLALDQNGNLWFVGDVTPDNYVGELVIHS